MVEAVICHTAFLEGMVEGGDLRLEFSKSVSPSNA